MSVNDSNVGLEISGERLEEVYPDDLKNLKYDKLDLVDDTKF